MSEKKRKFSRILFTQPSLSGVGGIEKVVPLLAKSLTSKNIEVNAACFYGDIYQGQNFWNKTFLLKETETKNLLHKLIKIYRRLIFFKKIINDSKPDLVITSAQGASLIMLLGKFIRLYDVPVVVYAHEGINVGGRIYKILVRLIYPISDGFICVSKGIQDEFFRVFKFPTEKCILAYNAIEKSSQVNDYDFDFDKYAKPYFVTASRLEEIKGVGLLVSSFISYSKHNPGTLFILGTGSLYEKIQTLIINNHLLDRIILVGYVDNVPGFVKKCNTYLSCAPSEPFGLSILEAISVGVPVVATDVPYGPREIMDVNDVNTYPASTPYGFLLRTNNKESTSIWQKDFNEALLEASKKHYDKTLLCRRVEFFSVDNQRDSVLELIMSL